MTRLSDRSPVEKDLHNVNNEIRSSIDDADNDREPDNQRVIYRPYSCRGDAGPGCVAQQLPETGEECVDVIDEDNTDDRTREDQTENHDDRRECIPESEAVVDLVFWYPVRPRRSYVVLAEYSLHGGASLPRNHSDRVESKC